MTKHRSKIFRGIEKQRNYILAGVLIVQSMPLGYDSLWLLASGHLSMIHLGKQAHVHDDLKQINQLLCCLRRGIIRKVQAS